MAKPHKIAILAIILGIAFSAGFATAASDLVAVSQMGYHPDSFKQVIVYTNATSGTASIFEETGGLVSQIPLAKAKSYNGLEVDCQGGLPCLVADFYSLKTAGRYYVKSDSGAQSPIFTISAAIYEDNLPILMEFYNAQLQQGSSYHSDLHSNYTPVLNAIADGSFIMEADQAAITLSRLGSAYRKNPKIFSDAYDISAKGIPDVQEYIVSYVNYLEGLQGVVIEERSDGVGFRLDRGVKINNAFVPGPTELDELDVFIGKKPRKLETVPVVSLCGEDNGSPEWDSCIEDAALYYKCQVDEPCLNISYIDRTGVVTGTQGFAVSRGWSYEFSCAFDVILDEVMFDGTPNPCLIFRPESNQSYTSKTLLAFLEAIPAVYDYSQNMSRELLSRSIATHEFIKENYLPLGDSDARGYWGAALFLLYDYTGEDQYLIDAYNIRDEIARTLISDGTHGNEFYWEEYIRHKNPIESLQLTYPISGEDPGEIFRGKLFFDYKDMGLTSISNNSERVFQFDPSIQFQNSRYMLTEGILAAKANDLNAASEDFIPVIAQSQLAWLTGMNAVQQGVALGSPINSTSFIYGIGNFPTKFHSRYMVDTGFRSKSNGEIIGIRGTNLQFYNGSDYIELDGRHEILGQVFGSSGNGWRDEKKGPVFISGRQFNNGKSYIPGWISGAFDISDPQETDVIYNYKEGITYEFTETTNEIVATAIELFAYLDAESNNKPSHDPINITDSTPLNETSTNLTLPYTNGTDTNSTNSTNTNSTIISQATNLTQNSSSGRYKMFETDSAFFYVALNESGLVNWSVDGGKITQTNESMNSSFVWNPGLLYTSNIRRALIAANAGSETANWDIDVEFVINPYFSSANGGPDILGSQDTTVNVFTNSRKLNVTNLSVTLESQDAKRTAYALDKVFAKDSEVHWKKYIPEMPYGNTILLEVSGFNNQTNETFSYSFGSARAHYRDQPQASVQSQTETAAQPRGTSGQGGGSGSTNPQIVYALFGNDVINLSQQQTLALDLKIGQGKIMGATGRILAPNGNYIDSKLALTKGTNSYGTWEGNLKVQMPGLYVLDYLLVDINKSALYKIFAHNTSFYAINGTVHKSERLALVNTILNTSTAEYGSYVSFTVDARDAVGISGITAVVVNSRGAAKLSTFNITLGLASGNVQYGTWKSDIRANEPDSTYSVREVTLSGNESSKTYSISKRSFYTNPSKTSLQGNPITGMATAPIVKVGKWSLDGLRKLPLLPTLFGFGAALAVSAAILLTGGFRQKVRISRMGNGGSGG